MKTRTMVMLSLLMISLLTTSERINPSRVHAGAPVKRISFRVAAIEETLGKREVISDATIDGMPGTDFVIDLQANRFKMSARFLTDLVSTDMLRIRTKLNTRRLYGYSERKLPLYEEDNQTETLQLGFDEQIILLPFGGNGSDNVLKIEITPSINERFIPPEKIATPEISIVDPGPGLIRIGASYLPHNFDVFAMLLENGREIARKSMRCVLEEPQEIVLQSDPQAVDAVENSLIVRFTVDRFEGSGSRGQATISFDAYQIDQRSGARQSVALNWSGVLGLDNETSYALKDGYLTATGKKYELRFKVKTVPKTH